MGKIVQRAVGLVAGLAVAISGAALTTGPASAATACSVTFKSYNSIKAGSTGDQAEAMECLLDEAGFPTTVDGSFSADDAQALAAFRESVELSPITVGGARAWVALLSRGTTPDLKSGDEGEDVLRLQLTLRAGGWTDTPADSTFGSVTVTKVKAAQKVRGEKQTGTVSPALWQSLQAGKVVAPITDTAAAAAAAKKAAAKKAAAKKAAAKKAAAKKKAAKIKAAKKKAAAKKAAAKKKKGAKALAFAKRQLGERYRYGAAGPNAWDCSGLTQKAWKSAGVKLPHNARAQFRRGKKVSKSNLRKGDLVFFYSGISHVGIYAGKGKIIHASRPGRPVAYIKMKYMPFKGARRPG